MKIELYGRGVSARGDVGWGRTDPRGIDLHPRQMHRQILLAGGERHLAADAQAVAFDGALGEAEELRDGLRCEVHSQQRADA